MSDPSTPLPEHVTARQLAGLLGVTVARVGQLRRAGIVPSGGRDKYPLQAAVSGYVAFLRRSGGEPGDLDPRREKAQLDRVRREIAEIERDERRGALLPRDLVIQTWQGIITVSRARLLALPTVAAPQCAGRPLPEIAAVLKDLVYAALRELARADVGAS